MESWKSLRTSPKSCRLANCRSLHISNCLHPRRAHEGVIGEVAAAHEDKPRSQPDLHSKTRRPPWASAVSSRRTNQPAGKVSLEALDHDQSSPRLIRRLPYFGIAFMTMGATILVLSFLRKRQA